MAGIQVEIYLRIHSGPLQCMRGFRSSIHQKRYRCEINEWATKQSAVVGELHCDLAAWMSLDGSVFEFTAVDRQEKCYAAGAHTDHLRVDHEQFVTVRDKQIFEVIHLQHLLDVVVVVPTAFQVFAGAWQRFCTEGQCVVVSGMPEADQDGLVLEVQVIELVDDVALVDGFVGWQSVISNATVKERRGVWMDFHC